MDETPAARHADRRRPRPADRQTARQTDSLGPPDRKRLIGFLSVKGRSRIALIAFPATLSPTGSLPPVLKRKRDAHSHTHTPTHGALADRSGTSLAANYGVAGPHPPPGRQSRQSELLAPTDRDPDAATPFPPLRLEGRDPREFARIHLNNPGHLRTPAGGLTLLRSYCSGQPRGEQGAPTTSRSSGRPWRAPNPVSHPHRRPHLTHLPTSSLLIVPFSNSP